MEARQDQLGESELARIRTPVLIVVGELDDVVDGSAELAGKLADCELLVLPGRNHMNAVPARQFKEAAIRFLAGEPAVPD
jgi:pimeloyl-ACP methyl ester carboxylesterase